MDEKNPDRAAASQKLKHAGKRWIIAGGIVVLVLGGTGIANAMAGRGPFGHMGPPMMMHGFGYPGMARVLDGVDATPEQRDQIEGIVDGLQGKIAPVLEGFGDTRQQLVALLGADTIDGVALEKFRAERIAALDAASRQASAALVEVAQVLTPQQRAELIKDLDGFGPRRPW